MRSYFHFRATYFLLLLVAFPVFGEGALQLSDGNNTLVDTNLWHALDDSVDVTNLDAMGKLERIKSTLQNARVMPSLGGADGGLFYQSDFEYSPKGAVFCNREC